MSGCPFLFLVPPYSPNTYPTIRPVMPIPSFFYCCFASFGMMLLTSWACLTRPLENHHSFPLLALYFLSYFPGFFPLVCTCTSAHLLPCILFPSCLIHTRHYVSPCKCRSYMQHRLHGNIGYLACTGMQVQHVLHKVWSDVPFCDPSKSCQ